MKQDKNSVGTLVITGGDTARTSRYVSQAEKAAVRAEQSAAAAEAWAVGESGGIPVGSTDETFHNNARHFAEHAAASAASAQIARTAAESAANAAQSAKDDAEAAAQSVAGSAAQIQSNKQDTDDLKSAIKMPTNLANSTSWGSGYVSARSGNIDSVSTLRHTDFIAVSGIARLTFKELRITAGSISSSVHRGMAFYSSNSEESFVDGYKYKACGADEQGYSVITTIDVPPTANYARFSWWSEDTEKESFAVYNAAEYTEQIPVMVNETKNLLNFVDLQTVLDNDATIENCVITSDGDVYPGGSRYSYQIANNGYGSIQLTAGNADTFISFLIDSVTGVSSRTPANICNGQPPRITITALSTETLQIPSDCQYIIIPCLIEGYTIAIKLMELLGIHNKSVLNDRTVVNRDFLTAWKVQGQHGSPVGFEDEITGDSNRKIAQKCAILACQRPMELSNIVTDLPANYPNAYPS